MPWRKEEERFQDFDLSVPWYVTGKGTKTYMVGMMDKDVVKMEEFPALIWRNAYEGTMVFAVNGDYMSGDVGMGLLSAMLYEMNAYAIYPVVNAQNAVVVDFPYLAYENAEEIEALYSRKPQAVQRDIFWPGIVSLASNNKLKLTCCISTKYDYSDSAAPMGEDLPFYLQQMKEISAEAGRSLNYKGDDITLEEKAQQDGAFYDITDRIYQFGAAYIEKLPENLEGLLQEENGLEEVSTLVCGERKQEPLISYINDSVTLQEITGVAEEYSYTKDLQLRSLATALGYSNLLIDMQHLRWPVKDIDRWENYSDEVFSDISTFWTQFDYFEQTTLSESDHRIRNFLNMDYEESETRDQIILNISGGNDDTWFILRLHDREVAKVENGEYEELEKGAYLIHGLADKVEIYLSRSEEELRYEGPLFLS